MDFLSKLLSTFDYVTNRFEVFVAEGEDLQKCFEVRDSVFGEELKRSKQHVISPAQVDKFDEDSVIFAGRDKKTHEIVGSFRVTPAQSVMRDKAMAKVYDLDLFPEKLLDSICINSRLCLLEEYRKSPLSLILVSYGYQYCLENDFTIGIIVCEPNLYPFYRCLGFRPLSRIYNSDFGGYRLPLFLLLHDYDFLRQRNSFLYRIAKSKHFPKNNDGINWFTQEAKSIMLTDPGFSRITTAETEVIEVPILQGLSKEGKKSLLKNAITVHCNAGDVIVSRSSGERTIGFITEGIAEVSIEGKALSIISKGDIFGEISFILGVPRTADVIAAIPDTQVVLLSLSCLKRLSKAEDRVIIWENIAKILSSRLASMSSYYYKKT